MSEAKRIEIGANDAIPQEAADQLRQSLRSLASINQGSKVYKDECSFSFDSPFSATGLYTNLSSLRSYGKAYLAMDPQFPGLYLFQKFTKVPKDVPMDVEEPAKLGLGVPGGFLTEAEKFSLEKSYGIAVFAGSSEFLLALENQEIPEMVVVVARQVIEHQGYSDQQDLAQWVDDEELKESKYAEALEQLDNGVKISSDPSTWKCEDSGMTENLWLNLSTGYIGSGRRNWDGSGGTNGALKHFEATGQKYPLVVKLGTITPDGADIYSYAPDENCMVKDAKLAEHLAHWGIDILRLEKTDKSMAELELEMNKNFAYNSITEAGAQLEPVTGAGFIGLRNLGNSCYMNSVVQLMFDIPEIREKYVSEPLSLSDAERAEDPYANLGVQIKKLATALNSDRYARPNPEEITEELEVKPRYFKMAAAGTNMEFRSGRQQDAEAFLQHLLEAMFRMEKSSGIPETRDLFNFRLTKKQKCTETGGVKYLSSIEPVLSLPVSEDLAVNLDEILSHRALKRAKTETDEKVESKEEEVVPLIPLDACLQAWAAEESVEDVYSALAKKRTRQILTSRLASFPRYLLVKLNRYRVQPGSWIPEKLDCEVDMPLELDLSTFRAPDPDPNEVPQPEEEEAAPAPPSGPVPDAQLVQSIMNLGFTENACKRAAVAVNNSDPDSAAMWLFQHSEDPDFNDPLPEASASGGSSAAAAAPAANPEAMGMLTGFGFTEEQVTAALIATSGDAERAGDWLFSHSNLDEAVAAVLSPSEAPAASGSAEPEVEDGPGQYKLVGFLSHIGKNTSCGHYVAHIEKKGEWIIFDDQKVAKSQNTPFKHGYLYLYRRK
uniref:Ubiquitin carboxyl-terminal hydrolase n=1 Tax=Pinguiococcus pyrenoidosus TaxID=172671 RepID=A0A7R9Y9N6_9STRA